MSKKKSEVAIKGIGEKFKQELELFGIFSNAEFLNATQDKVTAFNPRLKRIWAQEQIKTGKNNVAAGPSLIEQAQCEVNVFQTTKRTVAEVSEEVIKAQDACKNVLPDHVLKNAWTRFVDKEKEHNKTLNDKYFSDGKQIQPLEKDLYVIISSSTVPVWLCNYANWKILFGKSDIFKGSGPSEVFSDTIGALFYALTREQEVPPPAQMTFLNMQLEHLMTRYNMPFFKLLTEHYEELGSKKGVDSGFVMGWLKDSNVTLFLAKNNLSFGDNVLDIDSLILDTMLSIDERAHFWRLAVDRKADLEKIRKSLGKDVEQLVVELCKSAPENSKTGRKNFCEDVLALSSDGNQFTLAEEVWKALPEIIFEERGPILRMFEKLEIDFDYIQEKDLLKFAKLVVECVIDTDSAKEVKKIDENGRSMEKVFELVKDETMKKLLLANLLKKEYNDPSQAAQQLIQKEYDSFSANPAAAVVAA